MSVIPTVTQDGVGVISAGQLNAYQFSCYNTGVLRTIVGQTGMTAYLQGQNVPADGYQGNFYWNYASTAADDNVSVIVPAGVVYGAWIRLTLAVASGGTGTTTSTGTGSVVLNNSPTLISPSISNPTFTSNTTGTGNIVLATSPTITTPTITSPTITGAVVLSGALTAASLNVSSGGTIAINSNQAVNGPACSVYLSTNQSITTATLTKVALNATEYDTNSSFSLTNYRFQPLVSGYYQCDGGVNVTVTSGTSGSCSLYKNGSVYKQGTGITSTFTVASFAVSTIVFFNGSSDYVELWVTTTGTTPSVISGSNLTWFNASMVRGQ